MKSVGSLLTRQMSRRQSWESIRASFPGLFVKQYPTCSAIPRLLLPASCRRGGHKIGACLHPFLQAWGPCHIRGNRQDSLVMNLDDLTCVGAFGPFVLSNTIGRNAKLIPGAVLRAVIRGYENLAEKFREYGIEISLCGGETADIGDLVRTIVVDSVLAVRMERRDFIDCSKVACDQHIVGLASFRPSALRVIIQLRNRKQWLDLSAPRASHQPVPRRIPRTHMPPT